MVTSGGVEAIHDVLGFLLYARRRELLISHVIHSQWFVKGFDTHQYTHQLCENSVVLVLH
jgi:hypothetical protein